MSVDYRKMQQAILAQMHANAGVTSIAELENLRIIPCGFIRETLRQLIVAREIRMDQGDTYSLLTAAAAHSPVVAAAPATTPAPSTTPAKKQGGTQAADTIACLRCQLKFPRAHFARPTGRRFRLCETCRTPDAPKPRGRPPKLAPPAAPAPVPVPPRAPDKLTIGALADRWSRRLMLEPTEQIRTALHQLVSTGMYGRCLADAADRLIAEGIQRARHDGILKRGDGNE